MIKFALGVLVGVIAGLGICAICIVAGNSDKNDTQLNNGTGERDD